MKVINTYVVRDTIRQLWRTLYECEDGRWFLTDSDELIHQVAANFAVNLIATTNEKF